MLHAVATWWDGVELWLTQLGFTLQVVLVVGVLGPLCWESPRSWTPSWSAPSRGGSRRSSAVAWPGTERVDRRYARLWVTGALVVLVVLVIVLNLR